MPNLMGSLCGELYPFLLAGKLWGSVLHFTADSPLASLWFVFGDGRVALVGSVGQSSHPGDLCIDLDCTFVLSSESLGSCTGGSLESAQVVSTNLQTLGGT